MSEEARVKPLEQVCQAFADHLFNVDRSFYDEGLDDFVVFKDGVVAGMFIWTVLYNPANGHFICSRTGTETRRQMATEESGEMKGTPWFEELMKMVFRLEDLKGESHEEI